MLRKLSSFRTALIASATLALAPAVHAQGAEPSPEERRATLNRDQAEFARNQLAQNAASRLAYEAAVKAREAEIAEREREHASRLREHEEAMLRWQATVAACRAGDLRGCGVR